MGVAEGENHLQIHGSLKRWCSVEKHLKMMNSSVPEAKEGAIWFSLTKGGCGKDLCCVVYIAQGFLCVVCSLRLVELVSSEY